MRPASLMTSMEISATGMIAQRIRMNVISSNIANAETTRTKKGGPYRRKEAVLAEKSVPFRVLLPYTPKVKLERTQRRHIKSPPYGVEIGDGVEVKGIIEDTKTPLKLVYDPDHPDADKNGYVKYPNVDIVKEMVDMLIAARAYEANLAAFNTAKHMALQTLTILRA